ncbi:MAG: hypothetical protein WCV91_00340 [Candidatus Margulisiibacteriota bacterium]|jgi:hypothetical protein
MAKKRSIKLILSLLIFVFTAGILNAAESFPPISGEIYGQAAPGAKSITINNKRVKMGANNNFSSTVNLRSGEKYLTLIINYGEFRVIKKFLVLRKSSVKHFKVYVPKEKIEKPSMAPARPRGLSAKEKRRRELLRKLAQDKLQKDLLARIKAAEKARLLKKMKGAEAFEYLYVWEFSKGKLLLVKKTKGVYTADIYIPGKQAWMELQTLSSEELRDLIDFNLLPSTEATKK